MVIWHNTADASRIPETVNEGQEVELWIGTYPIEFGQSVWVEMKLRRADGREMSASQPALWHSNNEQRNNSYWLVQIGVFEQGDHLEYAVKGKHEDEEVTDGKLYSFEVA